MKPIYVVILFLVLLSVLSACNDSDSKQAISSKTKIDSEQNKQVTTSKTNSENTTQEAMIESPRSSNELNDFHSLIPSGWKMFEKDQGEPIRAEGDLNNDGVVDIAAIIEQDKDMNESEGAQPRALIIAFGTAFNSYSLSIIADKVILKADEGGVWGDPFDSLSIDKGSVIVSEYGGSNWRWYNKYKFRFQDHEWYLIGATKGNYFTGNVTKEKAEEKDYNFLTGDYIFKTTDENGKAQLEKGNRGQKELVKLKDFNIVNI